MLRMYLLQCWLNLPDEGVEDAICDSYAVRKFMGISFFEQDVPDATTLLHFRHLLEEQRIGKLVFEAINRRPGRLPRVSDSAIDWERYIENRKSAVRCKVEHPCRIVKKIFGFRKATYRGLRKNLNRLHVLFASANLYMPTWAGSSLRPAWWFCAPQAG